MTAEVGSFHTQQRAEEWVVVADNDNLDSIAVDVGRSGSSPLAQEYVQRFGERNADWRVVDKPLEHNSFGRFAQALGLIPVRIEASVDAFDQDQQRQKAAKIWGRVSRDDFYKGLQKIG